jgi:hypothetical protein
MEMQTCREVAQRLVYEFYTARYDEPETWTSRDRHKIRLIQA